MPNVKDIFSILSEEEKGKILLLARKWEHEQNVKAAAQVALTPEEVGQLQNGAGHVRVIKQVKDRTGHKLSICKLAVERVSKHVETWDKRR
jgi:hypothetical protein